MKIEHVAFMMSDPVAAAKWYVENLGFTVIRGMDQPPFAHFMLAPGGGVMLEIYNNPKVEVPNYPCVDPLLLHFAFDVEDVPGTRARLMAAGATPEGEVTMAGGDELAMLRDPWGVAVQLVKRAKPMI
jgi:glyoxylase I family protein